MTREKKRSEQTNSLAARRINAYLFAKAEADLEKTDLLKGLVKGYLSKKFCGSNGVFPYCKFGFS